MGTDDMNELEPEEPTFEQASQEAPTSEAREEHEPAPRPAYVREPRHHKSQPPVNDVQADETYDNQYSHESGYTLSTRKRMSRGAYRSARSARSSSMASTSLFPREAARYLARGSASSAARSRRLPSW